MICEQKENISQELENSKRNQKASLELKSIIIEMKNSLDGLKGRNEQANEIMNEFEYKAMGNIKCEEQK